MAHSAVETFPSIVEQLNANPAVIRCHMAKHDIFHYLAPYKSKIIYHNNAYSIAGRDSLACAQAVQNYSGNTAGQLVAKMGNFIQKGENVTIHGGGEHYNKKVLNHTLSHWHDVKEIYKKQGILFDETWSKGVVYIGNNVTISANATLLSGISIGDGAVIGANAVVSKDVPPFAIVAGNPAKVVGYRFDDKLIETLLQIRWWDFTVPSFLNHLPFIQQAHLPEVSEKLLALGAEHYDKQEKFLVFSMREDNHMDIKGVEVDGIFTPVDQLPEVFHFFILQLKNPPNSVGYFIKDIFALAGL